MSQPTGEYSEPPDAAPTTVSLRQELLPPPITDGLENRPSHFGNYEILGEIGRGGMGVVYKARQTGLNRLVALKMFLTGNIHPDRQARFQTEGEAVARLQHPNVVQVFEVGKIDGKPFLSLEFVEGGNLAGKLGGTPLPPREAAELVQVLAQGVEAAHKNGIVHRDLKPSNILLKADGTPKIADFGLAKLLGDPVDLTHTGAIMGTPSYMAPEQAAGNTKEIGPASDIYALGCILYELLTGRPPFRGATTFDTLEQVRSQAPVPPKTVNFKVPRDLETICMKCLEKVSGKRYDSAQALADDAGRFLNGEPIKARRPTLPYLANTWVRRHLRAVAASLMTGLIFGALAGLGLFSTFPAKEVVSAYEPFPSLSPPAFFVQPMARWQGEKATDPLAAFLFFYFYVGLPSMGLVTVYLARPRDPQIDVAVGLLMGLVAGLTAFATGLGWICVDRFTTNAPLDNLRILSARQNDPPAAASGVRPDQLLEKFPDLGRLPENQRQLALFRKTIADIRTRSFPAIVAGIFLSVLLFGACGTFQTVLAGHLYRRTIPEIFSEIDNPLVRKIAQETPRPRWRWPTLFLLPYAVNSFFFCVGVVILTSVSVMAIFFTHGENLFFYGGENVILYVVLCLAALVTSLLFLSLAAVGIVNISRQEKLFRIHQAILSENASLLGTTRWFAASYHPKTGWVKRSLAQFYAYVPGILFVADDQVRFAGRSYQGKPLDLVFRPGEATVSWPRLRLEKWRTLGPKQAKFRPLISQRI